MAWLCDCASRVRCRVPVEAWTKPDAAPFCQRGTGRNMVIALMWHGARGGYGSGWLNCTLLLNHAEIGMVQILWEKGNRSLQRAGDVSTLICRHDAGLHHQGAHAPRSPV